jgi:hypothetical protein
VCKSAATGLGGWKSLVGNFDQAILFGRKIFTLMLLPWSRQ